MVCRGQFRGPYTWPIGAPFQWKVSWFEWKIICALFWELMSPALCTLDCLATTGSGKNNRSLDAFILESWALVSKEALMHTPSLDNCMYGNAGRGVSCVVGGCREREGGWDYIDSCIPENIQIHAVQWFHKQIRLINYISPFIYRAGLILFLHSVLSCNVTAYEYLRPKYQSASILLEIDVAPVVVPYLCHYQ